MGVEDSRWSIGLRTFRAPDPTSGALAHLVHSSRRTRSGGTGPGGYTVGMTYLPVLLEALTGAAPGCGRGWSWPSTGTVADTIGG
jgi:hypothetical protein